jgi:mono/diheme cytochrome c family protein
LIHIVLRINIEIKNETFMKKQFIFLVFLLAIFLIGCDDQLNVPTDEEIPENNISYSKHIQPIFNARCATAGCHDDQTKAGGLSLTSYQNTTAGYSFVFPGNPDASLLVLSVEGRSQNPMPPPGRPPLTQKQIKAIRTWVAEGAKNN